MPLPVALGRQRARGYTSGGLRWPATAAFIAQLAGQIPARRLRTGPGRVPAMQAHAAYRHAARTRARSATRHLMTV